MLLGQKLILTNMIMIKRYMKIKLNSNHDLPLNTTLELCSVIIVIRSVFHECYKYYPQVFLDKCLYKL